MNVLSIGNSFSEDAQKYLYKIAKAGGRQLYSYNLYIGGCSLSRHYRNMLSGERAYTLQMNGQSTGFPVSLSEGLLNRDWDVITLQQVSSSSAFYDSYQPYLGELAAYVRKCCPKAKILIHQTWAYEAESERIANMGFSSRGEMFENLKRAYDMAAAEISADGIIPSGKLLEALTASGTAKVHRDGAHASLGIGRYAIGLLWYATITGGDPLTNEFDAFETEVTPEDVEIAKRCVADICVPLKW